jgi:Rha family phage regulatory protein
MPMKALAPCARGRDRFRALNFEETASTRPVVRIDDDQTYTTSLDIAAYCRKRHCDVLRAIENLNCSEHFHRRNFAEIAVPDSRGLSQKAYRITRSGAAFLITGFTGAEAGRFKEAYINEFDRMEAVIRAKAIPASAAPVDLDDPGGPGVAVTPAGYRPQAAQARAGGGLPVTPTPTTPQR